MASSRFSEQMLTTLHTKLTEWWDVVRELRTDSTPEVWVKFTSYLNPNCTVYFNGMGAPPCKGLDDTIEQMKSLLSYWAIKERQVLSQGINLSGNIISTNLLNTVVILGKEVDLPQAEVVEFDEQGQIVDYKLYVDPSPIMAIITKSQQEG